MAFLFILVLAGSYLLGSVPFGYLVYRLHNGGDLRSVGSGNIGTTNVMRGAGATAALATLLFDAGKGYLAVIATAHLTGHGTEWMSLAAMAAIAGHIFSAFLNFRGGKGVATAAGAFFALAPFPALWSLIIFILVSACTRYISLASVVAAGAFPWILMAYHHSWARRSPYTTIAAFVSAGLIIASHRSNILRLRAGTEPQIDFANELRGRNE